MSKHMTTTKNGFRVEDVTFKHARKQSEIENEIEHEDVIRPQVKAPVSLTPEQVIDFLKTQIAIAGDSNEKRLYSQVIVWIKELHDIKKKVLTLREKMIVRSKEDKEIDDIVED